MGKNEKAPSTKQGDYSPTPPAFSRQVLHACRISSFCSSYSFLILWTISVLPEDMAKQQERQVLLFNSGHLIVFSTSFPQIAHSSGIAFPLLGPLASRLWNILPFYLPQKWPKCTKNMPLISQKIRLPGKVLTG